MKRKFKMFMLYFRFYLSRIKSFFLKDKEEEPISFIYEDYRDNDKE